MSSVNRICERLPAFYRSWSKDTMVYKMVEAVGEELDVSREKVMEMMRSHWVDTASGVDLDKMGPLFGLKRILGEDDAHYRNRLKAAVVDFTGGGTLESIRSMLRSLVSGEVEIVENPAVDAEYELKVMAGDSWSLGNCSVEDVTVPEISIEAEDVIENPQVVNEDLNESFSFQGKMSKGDRLVFKEGKCFLNDEDVSDRVTVGNVPHIYRKPSNWRYVELIREKIGVFDSTAFDESIFAVSVPKAKVAFKWRRYQPATILVRIGREALNRSRTVEEYVKDVLGSIKAAGVKVIVEGKE